MASSIGKKEIKLDPKYGRINPSKRFLSEPMMNHILKNASPKTYFKLIQTTKYFLVNELPQIKRFEGIFYEYSSNKIKYIIPGENEEDEDMSEDDDVAENMGKRVWISTKTFDWDNRKNDVARYLERIYRCDVTDLALHYQTLTYDDLKIFMKSGTVELLNLWENTITHSNGDYVDIEDILIMTPIIQIINYHSGDYCFNFTSQKTAALPVLKNLTYLVFGNVGESFDCSAFCEFLKKNKFPYVKLHYTNPSLSYQHELQEALGSIPNRSITEKRHYLEIERRRVTSRKRV